MIIFDIKEKDINNMFNYLEAIDKKDDVSIPNILKRKKKAGRKPIDLQLVENLRKKNMNDIAIYVAIFLSKQASDKWSVDDIENVLENENFIDETLIPLLHQENKAIGELSEQQKKELAEKIKFNILQNEKETITMIGNYVKEKKREGGAIFVHQLSNEQLNKIKEIILKSFEIFEKILDDFDGNDYLNHQVTEASTQPTYVFMNDLLGISNNPSGFSILTEIKIVLDELKEILNEEELNEQGKEKVKNYINTLEKYQNILNKLSEKNVIWIQADNSITDINTLEQYFNQLEDDREKAQKTINKYKKMKNSNIKLEKPEQKSLNYKDIINIVKEEVRKKAREINLINMEDQELVDLSNKMAEDILQKNPEMEKVFEKFNHEPFSELSSMINQKLKSKYITVGRPKGE